jgi:hypothetical protein
VGRHAGEGDRQPAVQEDIPLTGNDNTTAFYTNVRLIYLDEIE